MKDTLAFQISVLYRDFLGYTTARLKELGLSFGQVPLVVYTGKHPGCPQADLTRALRLDWGYCQRSIGRLAEGGFLTKAYDSGAACNRLTLTPRGEEAFRLCHQVFRSWDEQALAGFSPEETRTLLALLDRLAPEEWEAGCESV